MAECCWFVNAEEQLAVELSKLALFQSFCGVATEAEALARVHLEQVQMNENNEIMVPAELAALRPFCLLWSENPGFRRIAEPDALTFGGQIGLLFEITIEQLLVRDPSATTSGKKARWLKDTCGRILVDLFSAWLAPVRVLQCMWELTHQLSGNQQPHASFYCNILYGPEET